MLIVRGGVVGHILEGAGEGAVVGVAHGVGDLADVHLLPAQQLAGVAHLLLQHIVAEVAPGLLLEIGGEVGGAQVDALGHVAGLDVLAQVLVDVLLRRLNDGVGHAAGAVVLLGILAQGVQEPGAQRLHRVELLGGLRRGRNQPGLVGMAVVHALAHAVDQRRAAAPHIVRRRHGHEEQPVDVRAGQGGQIVHAPGLDGLDELFVYIALRGDGRRHLRTDHAAVVHIPRQMIQLVGRGPHGQAEALRRVQRGRHPGAHARAAAQAVLRPEAFGGAAQGRIVKLLPVLLAQKHHTLPVAQPDLAPAARHLLRERRRNPRIDSLARLPARGQGNRHRAHAGLLRVDLQAQHARAPPEILLAVQVVGDELVEQEQPGGLEDGGHHRVTAAHVALRHQPGNLIAQLVLELLHFERLEEIGLHAVADGLLRQVEVIVPAEDQEPAEDALLPGLADHLQPVHAGHLDVDDDQIRPVAADGGQGRQPVRRRVDHHGVVVPPGDDLTKAIADGGFIIGNEYGKGNAIHFNCSSLVCCAASENILLCISIP